ncbi:hypothetical protein ACVI1L_006178 [Bradyrhizobium sp. USDA 4516]
MGSDTLKGACIVLFGLSPLIIVGIVMFAP